ncbi:TetR/AcrR family transcriptional regulator [Actinomadura xylanilytica]|uniref:TetR/AcrR family transcriptional regulator n=1 Tax=Actinomadura xylanilytica TaxID=887459 RepID=UPI00255A93B1|nr:TetR/AcrR family transcriptional regulator [Actinomadura xylanilytica]MDL4777632.1 helix-turn-helix domain-containing protein [Actinomadura xylanilytica]
MPASRRPRRADAQRNHDLLVAAARRLFAERGPEAPLDDVARDAGVGNATLYRHFPTRRELLIAVYADEVSGLTAEGEALLAGAASADALFAWLRTFITHVATKRDLAQAITDERRRTVLFDEWHTAMHATAGALLARAQDSGAVRPGVRTADLMALANGIALATTGPPQTDRLLDLLRQGVNEVEPAQLRP